MFAFSGLKKSLLFLLLFLTLAVPAFAVELLGNWIYRQSGGDNQDTQSEFQQRYQLGIGPAASWQPTPAITVTGGVGYRQTERDIGEGRETVKQVSPFAGLSLLNDIFIVDLSADSYTTMAGSDNSSSSWNSSISSAWYSPLWPNLRFSYGEDFQGVNKSTLFDDSNGKDTNTTVTVDWDLLLANLFYEYSINEFIDGFGDSRNKATSHYGRLETNGQFWNSRFGYSLSQQYRETTAETNVDDSAVGDEGSFFTERVSGVTGSLETSGAANVDEQLPAPNPFLSDGVFNALAQDVPVNNIGYFSFRTGSNEQIDSLYLSLDTSAPPLNSGAAAALQWELWVRRPVPIGLSEWTPMGSVPAFFNIDEERFEIFVDIDEPEIMVVTTNLAGTPLSFSELEAFRLITESGDNKTTSYKTNASARYRIARDLNTFFTFGYDHDDDKKNGVKVRENDKISWSGRLQWTPLPYITPSFGYSEYRQERTGRPDDLNRLYSMTVATNPLPSLSLSVAYTRNDRYEDKEKTYGADTYSLYTKLAIYPDLNASFTASYTDSDTLDENDTSGEEIFVNTKSITTRTDVTARLYRHLTAYATVNFNTLDNDIIGKRKNANTSCSLNYRPSDILNFQVSYDAFFLDNDRQNALAASAELFLLRTYKSRLSFYASHIQAEETLDNFSMIGSWDISDYFSLTTSGSYNMGPTDAYSFYVSLALQL